MQKFQGTVTARGIVPHLKARGILCPVALRVRINVDGARELVMSKEGLPEPEMMSGAMRYVLPSGKHVTAAQARGEDKRGDEWWN
ncbi:MAG: hypothetical protein KGH75_06050 [Rhodospirillales bacterium]|nr:hypothetical protein [Rhodospirillales bacterium]